MGENTLVHSVNSAAMCANHCITDGQCESFSVIENSIWLTHDNVFSDREDDVSNFGAGFDNRDVK